MTKLLSWNVNGIRAVLKKNFKGIIENENPDIICLQETKSAGEDIDVGIKGYHCFWNHAKEAGYSGTAIFSKIKPISVKLGLGVEKHDQEGRVITAEFSDYFVVNVYVPNSKRDLSRLPYRSKEWDVDFLKYLKSLEKKKSVIFCGDMNVAHQEIDLSNPKTNTKNHGFTPEERLGFENIIKAGFVDTFREKVKEGGHYTWWNLMFNCRARNIGWRIDYFCISKSLVPKLKEAAILKDVMGSDHCPIVLILK